MHWKPELAHVAQVVLLPCQRVDRGHISQSRLSHRLLRNSEVEIWGQEYLYSSEEERDDKGRDGKCWDVLHGKARKVQGC